MEKENFDCVVLGSGPGGYIAAIRAAQLGLSTALVESSEWGGTCLNRGCIPSKTLIAGAEVWRKAKEAAIFGIHMDALRMDYSALNTHKDGVVSKIRKGLEHLLQSNRIRLIRGRGRLTSPHEISVVGADSCVLGGDKIILATGSSPRSLPILPCDGLRVHDSTSFLNLKEVPQRLLIVGGGVIGCEFASLHHALGAQVTILEALPNLINQEGKQVSDALTRSFQKRGIQVVTHAAITKAYPHMNTVNIELADGRSFEGDHVLVSVGRQANSTGIGLEIAGVPTAPNGTIPVNAYMQTHVPHIFAIGDVTGISWLAHVASHQGILAAENAAGKSVAMKNAAIPSVIFTYPEIATVGYTLEKATEMGLPASVGSFPFQALGKAQAIAETDGFAQIVTHTQTGQILGAQIMGPHASSLIGEMTLAMEQEILVEDVAHTIHAHPTLSEGWMEAAWVAMGSSLHLPPRKPHGK